MSLLISLLGDVMPLNETLPQDMIEHLVPGSTPFYSRGDFGKILVQKIQLKNFTLWHFVCRLRKSSTLSLSTISNFLAIFITLKKSVNFLLPELGWQRFEAGQFNIYGANAANSHVFLNKGGHIEFLLLSIDPGIMNEFIGSFPHLKRSSPIPEKGSAKLLAEAPLWIGPLVDRLLAQILSGSYNLPYQRIHLDIHLRSILFELLYRHNTLKNQIAAKHDIAAKVQLCKDQIDQTLPSRPAIAKIAAQLSLNEDFLKREFKRIYHLSVSQYIIETNIRKARTMFQSGRTIKEVMGMLQYKSKSSFLRLFISKTGKRPKEIKRAILY